MGGIVLKTTTTVLLIVISSRGHLEKRSMWLHTIHMTGYLLVTANMESCIFRPRVLSRGGRRMNTCVENLVTAGG